MWVFDNSDFADRLQDRNPNYFIHTGLLLKIINNDTDYIWDDDRSNIGEYKQLVKEKCIRLNIPFEV